MTQILLTGFTPFGEMSINPTEQLMAEVARQAETFAAPVETLVLETTYTVCEEQFAAALARVRPEVVLSFGVALGRDELCLERIAVNLDDAQLADNQGEVRQGQRIVEEGPVGFWSTLPLDSLYQALQQAGIPVRFSNHAGAYLCNHLFYYGRHRIETEGLPTRMGFIHVPPLPEQVAAESGRQGMSLETLLRAVRVCVERLVDVS